MSAEEAYDRNWKEKVPTRIKRSHWVLVLVLVLVNKNSLQSSRQKWEIKCAARRGKGSAKIWAYSDDRTNLNGVPTYTWSDKNTSEFIDSL